MVIIVGFVTIRIVFSEIRACFLLFFVEPKFLAQKFREIILLFFENHRKSLIQHIGQIVLKDKSVLVRQKLMEKITIIAMNCTMKILS